MQLSQHAALHAGCSCLFRRQAWHLQVVMVMPNAAGGVEAGGPHRPKNRSMAILADSACLVAARYRGGEVACTRQAM